VGIKLGEVMACLAKGYSSEKILKRKVGHKNHKGRGGKVQGINTQVVGNRGK